MVEACEAYGSFLQLTPMAIAVTNVDDDHLDNYGSRAALDEAFVDFMNRVPFWGKRVVNYDDPGLQALLPRVIGKTLTYGLAPAAELRAERVVMINGAQEFMVRRQQKSLGRVKLNLPGRYNLLNALAAIGLALELGVKFNTIKKAVAEFTGVKRRWER